MNIGEKKISESILATSFEKCLRNGCFKEFPKFRVVAREIACRQGIADFITIAGRGLQQEHFEKINRVFNGSTESYVRVFSLLKPSLARREKYITEKSGLSLKTVRIMLKQLKEKQAAVELKKGLFVLSHKWRMKSMELWAFELKISNRKRAIFQSLQYKAFADRVIIVFPMEKEKLLEKSIEQFKKFKVGVMLFDAVKNNYRILLPPIKSKPSSRAHRLFAFSKISPRVTIGSNGRNVKNSCSYHPRSYSIKPSPGNTRTFFSKHPSS